MSFDLTYFKEALLLEMSFNKKKVIVSELIVPQVKIVTKISHFYDLYKGKRSLSIVTGDFNAKSSSWWCTDIKTIEGSHLYSLTSSIGFSQLINEATHIQTNSTSSIDLIFTNQPNLSGNSGVHSSLHQNCHHQIVHVSFNLDIYYVPHYTKD